MKRRWSIFFLVAALGFVGWLLRQFERTSGSDGEDAVPQGARASLGASSDQEARERDRRLAAEASLPIGLSAIDGSGGAGRDRAVKKNGVWYPVYGNTEMDGEALARHVIPLTIVSGPAPLGRVHEAYAYRAEAIGGTAPYRWEATRDAGLATLHFDEATAELRGTPNLPSHGHLSLRVTDGTGFVATATLRIVIRPDMDLAILTTTLPVVTQDAESSYRAVLEAAGGVPPYTWSTADSLPIGMTLDASTGVLSGIPEEDGSYDVTFQVVDAQAQQAAAELTIESCEDLRITNENGLPPAPPGRAYSFNFTAEGGAPPYAWSVAAPAEMDPAWQLSAEGELRGMAPPHEALHRLTIAVTDSSDRTYTKTFHLMVGDLLIAIPSREKVGLAWSRPAIASVLSRAGLAAMAFRVTRHDRVIFEGAGDNLIDPAQTGESIRYQLDALTRDGDVQPLASKDVTVLPMSLQKGQAGVRGDPFADRVVDFRPLTAGGYGAALAPGNVLGPPQGRSTYAPAYRPHEVLSLHVASGAGGAIDLEFTDNIVASGPGEDFTVFENVFFIEGDPQRRFMEPAVMSIALFPGEWHRIACDVLPSGSESADLQNPHYYARGFAGRNASTGDDPTDPKRSGGDSLDVADTMARAGLTWFRYLRLESTGDAGRRDDAGGDVIRHPTHPVYGPLSGKGSSGFDLDAVSAVHY
jgi:hypothetical protein